MASDEAKHVFVSYVREDSDRVDMLCEALEAANIPCWRDRNSLAPGDEWKREIRDAIRSGALVFLACFSEQSQARAKSYMNEELALAAEEFRLYPPGATWLIPVRFDDVDVPTWDLGAGRTLTDLNFADLFGSKYVPNLVSLTNTINKIMGITSPDLATVRASVEEATDADRPSMLRRMTKDMILDASKRVALDALISQETQHILAAMRDEDRFPTQTLDGTAEDQLTRSAEIAASYWQLAEPLCTSLQIASRWAEEPILTSWASALRAIAGEALKSKGGNSALLQLQHLPALTATFTAAFGATGQNRWDNFKTLLVDVTLPQRYGREREPLLQAENPWTPFGDLSNLLPNVIARCAITGEDAKTAFNVFASKQTSKYYTPVAEWLHSILRPHFSDQYPDDSAYDDTFDRTEIMLGIVSQDIENVRAAANPDRITQGHSAWFGRSTWRRRHGVDTIGEIAAEIESEGQSWRPLTAGLFGGDPARATNAITGYLETFKQIARSRR